MCISVQFNQIIILEYLMIEIQVESQIPQISTHKTCQK